MADAPPPCSSRSGRFYPLLFAKGMAVGAADLVPGVSGGTIAFISGIYEELIDTIRNLRPQLLVVGYREGFGAMWREANATFLATLLLGVLCSIFSLARLIAWVLEEHPILIWSFFFGLIVGSIVFIARRYTRFDWPEKLALAMGTVLGFIIVFSPPLQMHYSAPVVFFSGALAACAMILPGISGTFILMLLGMYRTILDGVVSGDVVLLATFASGAVAGLVVFSRLLSWLLHHYHDLTMTTMTGFLIGSLALIWPWKLPLEVIYDEQGRETVLSFENLLPWQYEQIMGLEAHTMAAAFCMALGLVLVLGLESVGNRGRTSLVAQR